jgi:hypothetical protein
MIGRDDRNAMELIVGERIQISHIGATVQHTPAEHGDISLLEPSAFYITNDINKSQNKSHDFHLLPAASTNFTLVTKVTAFEK